MVVFVLETTTYLSKGGRYSIGTFAHPDIAFEFASWLSPEFKLYLITEFERLKANESYQAQVEWQANYECQFYRGESSTARAVN